MENVIITVLTTSVRDQEVGGGGDLSTRLNSIAQLLTRISGLSQTV